MNIHARGLCIVEIIVPLIGTCAAVEFTRFYVMDLHWPIVFAILAGIVSGYGSTSLGLAMFIFLVYLCICMILFLRAKVFVRVEKVLSAIGFDRPPQPLDQESSDGQ